MQGNYTTTEQHCRGCMGPCGRCYTEQEFLQCIRRELLKRFTTYPKIITKKIKQGQHTPEQIQSLVLAQEAQNERLQGVHRCIESNIKSLDPATAEEYYKELLREQKMRKTYYPRLIYFKRITPEVAEQETAVWSALVDWFFKMYI